MNTPIERKPARVNRTAGSEKLGAADRAFIRFTAVLLQVPEEVVLANLLARRSRKVAVGRQADRLAALLARDSLPGAREVGLSDPR